MRRIAILADHPLIVRAIRTALDAAAGHEVAGWIDGQRNALAALSGLKPDVVVVDDMDDRPTALSRVREVAEAVPGAACLLLAGRADDDLLDAAFAAGAHAVLGKEMDPAALRVVLRETARGRVAHRPPVRRAPSPSAAPLTRREAQILTLAAEGLTNRRIGRELWLTEQTVKFHLSNTYRKLGVSNRTEASHFARTHGLLVGPETGGAAATSAVAAA